MREPACETGLVSVELSQQVSPGSHQRVHHASRKRKGRVSRRYDRVVLPSAAELKSPTAMSAPRPKAGPKRNSLACASWTAAKSCVSRWVLTKWKRSPRYVPSIDVQPRLNDTGGAPGIGGANDCCVR